MLEKIADFLIEPNIYWCGTEIGVEFYDFKYVLVLLSRSEHNAAILHLSFSQKKLSLYKFSCSFYIGKFSKNIAQKLS